MRKLIAAVSLVALTGCSEVGIGLKNHPIDCALGFAWADCLPGTPGYNARNGVGGGGMDPALALTLMQMNNQNAAFQQQNLWHLQDNLARIGANSRGINCTVLGNSIQCH